MIKESFSTVKQIYVFGVQMQHQNKGNILKMFYTL